MSTIRLLLLLGLLLPLGCGQPSRPVVSATNDPVRIVSLSPSLTEMICAIGAADCLVGRSSACHYPPEALKNVPVAGNFGIPSLELLAKCAPQLVVTVDLEDQNSALAIERLGIRYEQVPCKTLDDIPRAVRRLGVLLHHETQANQLAGEFEAKLTALRARSKDEHPPRVFLEVWDDPLMTAGKTSFLTELVELAGGHNIAGDVNRDYYPITPEAVLTRDPEVLIMLEADNLEIANKRIAPRSGWAEMSAVRNGRVCTGLNHDLIETPGPRVLGAVDALRPCIHHEP